MFKNTTASIDAIIRDVKTVALLVTVISNLICIGYFTYASIVGTGFMAINIATVVISLAYIIIYAVTYSKKGTEKKVHSVAAKINSGAKLVFRTITLVATIYGIIIAGSNSNGITIILATLSILMWIVSFVVEVLKYYVEIRFNQLKESLKKDLMAPVNTVKAIGNGVANAVKSGIEIVKVAGEAICEDVEEIICEGKEAIHHGMEAVVHGPAAEKSKGLFFKMKQAVLMRKSEKEREKLAKKEAKLLKEPKEKQPITK